MNKNKTKEPKVLRKNPESNWKVEAHSMKVQCCRTWED